MLFRSGYFLKRALRNMRQSPVLSLASVGTVAVALALLAFFAIAVLNVQQLTASAGSALIHPACQDQGYLGHRSVHYSRKLLCRVY